MDSILLRIVGKEKFLVTNWAQFVPEFSARKFADLSQNERIRAKEKKLPYLRHFVLHPEQKDGLYTPRVEIYESADSMLGTVDYEMKITVSCPKLLFENNLQEVIESDQRQIAAALSDRLGSIGIRIFTAIIEHSPVSAVHLCKNVILPQDISLRSILAELSRADMGKAYDTTDDMRRKDKNNSEIVHLYCNTRDWTFYDKAQDIRRPKGKSADKVKTDYEKELLDLYDLDRMEVFRFEYRLNKAQTIRSEINTLLGRPYSTPVLFTDLFTEGLWKKVLLNAWKKIINRPENQLALISADQKYDLWTGLLTNARKDDKSAHSQNKTLVSYALAAAAIDFGAKVVRRDLHRVWSDKADERLDKKMARAAALASEIPISNGLVYIGKEIERFEQVTLDSLPKRIS